MRLDGGTKAGINHATAHYGKIGRLGNGHPFLRFQYAAGLGHFQEKTVRRIKLDNLDKVIELHSRFVGEDGHVYLPAEARQAIDVPPRYGLFGDKYVIPGYFLQDIKRLVVKPAAIGINHYLDMAAYRGP